MSFDPTTALSVASIGLPLIAGSVAWGLKTSNKVAEVAAIQATQDKNVTERLDRIENKLDTLASHIINRDDNKDKQ